MSSKAKKDPAGTFVLSDDAMDEMQNLEATTVMDDAEELPPDDDATVVLGKTYRLKVTGATES